MRHSLSLAGILGVMHAFIDASTITVIFSTIGIHKVPWQTGELGKVDEGGGGTIAKFLAEHNMEVVDCGPALLSLHAPFEISSKADLYAAYQGYKVFYRN